MKEFKDEQTKLNETVSEAQTNQLQKVKPLPELPSSVEDCKRWLEMVR